MTEPLLYEADPQEFLERVRRTTAHLARLREGGRQVDVVAWSREMAQIQAEVEPIPFVPGVRYRLRMHGGAPTVEHRHFDTPEGIVGVNLPRVVEPSFIELEGWFLERVPIDPMPGTGTRMQQLQFNVGGRLAAMADSDVLRAEEIR